MRTIESIELEIKKIIIENAKLNISVEELTTDKDLIQLGIDSITGIKIFVAIEDRFDFEFDEKNLNPDTFKNITQLCAYVQSKLLEVELG